jgi:large subunit ribosomal protein L23
MKTKKTKVEQKNAKALDYTILLEPVITEKAAQIGGDSNGGVVFKVAKESTKTEIRNAVERIFNVEVETVRTINYLGKPKKSGRSVGRRASWKKAYIKLKPGFAIELIEGV